MDGGAYIGSAPAPLYGQPPPNALDGGMHKRGRDDDPMDTSKRAREEGGTVLKLLVANALTGQVIGKQGVVVNRIMDESGARVKVSLVDEVIPKTGERVVTLTGSIESVTRAQQLISAQLAEPKPGEERTIGPTTERTLKLLVPNGAAGVVIGKQGSVIKELLAQTGCTIKVSQPADIIVASQERIISLTGTQDIIDAAQHAICVKLSQAPPSQQPKAIDYCVLKELPPPSGYPPSYGPPGSAYPPPPYGYSHHQPPPHGHPPPAAPQGHSPYGYSGYATAPSYYGQAAPAPLAAGGPGASHGGALPPPGGGPGSSGGPPPRQWHQAPPPPAPGGGATHSTSMALHDTIIAGVIGKGGSIIKEIGQRSGATIKVSQKDTINAAGERMVTIEGTNESVGYAERLIRERVQQVEQENSSRRAGGSAPPGGMHGQQFREPAGSAYSYQPQQPPPPSAPSWQSAPSTYQPGAGGSGGYQFC